MKLFLKIYAFFMLLTVAACFDPPKYRPEDLDKVRIPQAQAMDVPARTYDFKGHSFGEDGVSQVPLAPMVEANAVKVALLVPLSGKAQKIGQMLADAAQLGIYTEGSSNVQLHSYDTLGTSEGATKAVNEAMQEQPDVILGPLFSNEVQAVAPIARAQGVKIFAFSNDKKVAGNGVYLLGLMPDEQIERVADFAAARGVQNFSALLPNNVLGNEVMAGLKRSVQRNAKNLPYAQIFAASETNFDNYAEQMMAKIAESGALAMEKDAVVLTESGTSLANQIAALQKNGLQKGDVRFVGINAWDNEKTLVQQSLQGGWFTNVGGGELHNFVDNFYTSFGYKPLPVASLSYDAVLLAAELGKTGLDDSSITKAQGFYGANGAYRFRVDGTAERQYDILEITGGNAYILDEAPKYFQ